MSISNIEMQDSNGNIYHPHTSAKVVFDTDGKPISTVVVLTHAKSGTVHTLTGTLPTTGIIQAAFKATSDFTEGNTFIINSTPYTAKPNGEELTLPDKAFITGDVVTIAVDVEGKKINFRVGGGAKVPSIFGDGSDGDLIIRAGQTVTLPVVQAHKDVIIKQYKSILIEATGKLTTAAPNCGFVIKCKGDCTIDGTIDQSGKGGFTNYDITYEYPAITCGSGGNGGKGGFGGQYGGNFGVGAASTPPRKYGGGIGGSGGGGGGGGNVYAYSSSSETNIVNGKAGEMGISSNDLIKAGLGGTGGVGSGGTGGKGGDGGLGAYGGGLILLYIGGNSTIRGVLSSEGNMSLDALNGARYASIGGGVATNETGSGGGGGGGASGGGGGGAIYICHNAEYLLTGTLNVNGGNAGKHGLGGVGSATKHNGYPGTAGTAGQIGEIKVVKYEKGQTV